jgi:hypothetical protein
VPQAFFQHVYGTRGFCILRLHGESALDVSLDLEGNRSPNELASELYLTRYIKLAGNDASCSTRKYCVRRGELYVVEEIESLCPQLERKLLTYLRILDT